MGNTNESGSNCITSYWSGLEAESESSSMIDPGTTCVANKDGPDPDSCCVSLVVLVRGS